jgi:hypothetical protein
MVATRLLDCVTPGRRHLTSRNPQPHLPLAFQNRVKGKLIGPDGEVKQEFVHEGNVMATYGLNNLMERIATGGEASDIVHMGAVGTQTTAEASDNTGLYAGTNSAFLSAASMNGSDLGNFTVEYQMTFDDASDYEIHEVGLLGTNDMSDSLIARTMVGTDSVNKQTADTVLISYQIVASTV